MKKILMTSLVALVLLGGCASTAEESQQPTEEANETVSIEAASEDTELETIALSKTPKTSLEGSYISIKSGMSPYEPSLMLFQDGTFEFTENCYEGLKIYKGSFSADATTLKCKVTEQKPAGFDKSELTFKRINDSILEIQDNICATMAGDLFVFVNQFKAYGTFVSTSKNFVENYEPYITFKDDGTFEMTENLLSGMGNYTGIYQYDGNAFVCKVQTVSFSGYAGADAKQIYFRKLAADRIYLCGNLCGSAAGDNFVAKDAPSAEPSSTEKKGTVFIVEGADSNRIKVRKSPGLSGEDTGERKYSGEKVTVYEETSKDGYTWYRIGTDRWMAGNGTSFGIKFD